MTLTHTDKQRSAAILAAYAKLDHIDQSRIDAQIDRIIDHIKASDGRNQMSRTGALEVLAAIGRVI